ncbi:pyridine nucleotide-disulfide oxidoreductase [Salinisphaera sp. T5B8]|uniref:NAD(P)/FAD-dependent oxidoreductase n=1 Tax=Salinisphaera sp. T5B8 TaxID=1304154 RepID=UPI0033417DE3
MKPLVLVGAGHSHIALLGRAERLRAAGFDITLVDPGSFWYGGAAAGVLAGQFSQAALKLPLRRFCADRGVHYRADRAIGMDTRHRRLWLASGDMLNFDTLSMDVGLENSLSVATGSHEPPQLWSAVDVSALLQFADTLMSESRGGALRRIAVVGAGARALEVVAGLGAHPQARAFQIAWFVPHARILPGAPVALERRIRRRLTARGVEIIAHTAIIQKVDGAIVSDDGRRFAMDHAVLAGDASAARFVHAARLPAQQAGLYVTRRLQSPSDARVYAAGACASVLGAQGEHRYSERHARVLAHNIEAGARQRPFQSVRANAGATVVDLGDGQAAGWRGRLWWQGRALARRKARSHAKWLALIAQYAPVSR